MKDSGPRWELRKCPDFMRKRLYLLILKSSLRGRCLFSTVQKTECWWHRLQALPHASSNLNKATFILTLGSAPSPSSLLRSTARTVPHALSTYQLSYTRVGFFHTKRVVNMLTINHSVCVCVCVCVCVSRLSHVRRVCVCVCVCVSRLSHVRRCNPWTVAQQAPLLWDLRGKNTGVGCHFLLQSTILNALPPQKKDFLLLDSKLSVFINSSENSSHS